MRFDHRRDTYKSGYHTVQVLFLVMKYLEYGHPYVANTAEPVTAA